MVTQSPLTTLSEMGVTGDGFSGEDLGLLLSEQRRQEAVDRERELNIFRSGSAPPTIEGSLSAVEGLVGVDGFSALMNGGTAKKSNGFLSEEELRSDPAYHAYYYSHVNLNPRLPPPLLSKEDWRFTQRLQVGTSTMGGVVDRRKPARLEDEGVRSLFSMQPGFNLQKEGTGVLEPRRVDSSREWLDKERDGLIGLPGIELGRQKSFSNIFQDDICCPNPTLGNPSRPASRNAFNDSPGQLSSVETHFALHCKAGSTDVLLPSSNVQSISESQSNGLSTSHTFGSVLGSSISRNATPNHQQVLTAPSCRPSLFDMTLGISNKRSNNGSHSLNGGSSGIVEPDDLAVAISNINLSVAAVDNTLAQSNLQKEIEGHQNFHFDLEHGQNHMKKHSDLSTSDSGYLSIPSIPQLRKAVYRDLTTDTGDLTDLSNSNLLPNGLLESHSTLSFSNSSGSSSQFPVADDTAAAFASYGPGGFSIDPTLSSIMANQSNPSSSPLFEVGSGASGFAAPNMDSRLKEKYFSESNLNGATNLHNFKKMGNRAAAAASLQMPVDPLYIQYMRAAECAAQDAVSYSDPSMGVGYMGNTHSDLLGIHKAYLEALLQSQKPYGMGFPGKSGGLPLGYYGNPAFSFGYPGSPLSSPVPLASSVGPGSPLRHTDRNMRFPSGIRNLTGAVMGAWRPDANGNMDGNFASSLLDEFKSNKTKSYELSEIAGHVVEFSADQYGSRFIQQKLETATTEEKDMVFEEIMPQALTLMTDVFGNYVVQKFLEHGSAAQKRELAVKLTGHVLALSLQMYGCRVIQKAIEVVDLDQQTKMVTELDGHVMRCVRDQNGNHVIQKCIECIPQDAIQFIISTFYNQVVTLSTHPYGCRVIQRVLEHCHDLETQQIMMDEILQSVCMLAQDQYGNYVVQHVLEHGKPHERSAIINKLIGLIVQMSLQKFASNVIEKCLTFGNPTERQTLINEMLGSSDENEPLEAMMKDQFGNYVVQKVLETCNDEQREVILTRIKVHLTALKKYTYGKHIVARVEKLVAAGERRIGIQSSFSS